MARTYIYKGEAESVVPFTLDGPRVVSAGDVVSLPDGDDSFEEHPLFEETTEAPETPQVPVVAPVVTPDEQSDPEQPVSQEPTA